MTKTRREVEGEIDGRMPQLVQLVGTAWRHGVHFAWTVDGEVVVGGPNTPAARSAMDALLPYAELLRQTGLLALADAGVPPMPSVEAAQDYVRHAVAGTLAGGLSAFLEAFGIGSEHVGEKTFDS